uniref:Uncharacterized protein n=1 Tax=Anguilla anguilla TaxID=7936 RepID=A0A0E9R586_ANGAN
MFLVNIFNWNKELDLDFFFPLKLRPECKYL